MTFNYKLSFKFFSPAPQLSGVAFGNARSLWTIIYIYIYIYVIAENWSAVVERRELWLHFKLGFQWRILKLAANRLNHQIGGSVEEVDRLDFSNWSTEYRGSAVRTYRCKVTDIYRDMAIYWSVVVACMELAGCRYRFTIDIMAVFCDAVWVI